MTRFGRIALCLAFAMTCATSSFSQVNTPQGRLTLVSNTPVMTTDLTGATTIYYTPYDGNSIPSYASAGQLNNNTFYQMALTTNNAVQSQGNIYDVFAFLTGGVTENICLGPAWTSTTSRGTGTGTTQLQRVQGILTNAQTFTNTCWNGTTSFSFTPNGGTYLGSVYMTGNASTSVQFKPSAAGGGSAPVIGLWNAYNRVPAYSTSVDSNSTWTYSSATWRAADNSNFNRITWLDGLQQSPVRASYTDFFEAYPNGAANIAVNLDSSTSTPDKVFGVTLASPSSNSSMVIEEAFTPQLGLHYIQAMESGTSGTTETFFGGAASGFTLSTEY